VIRGLARDALLADAVLASKLQGIFGAGSLTTPPPSKPYIVVRAGAAGTSAFRGVMFEDVSLWVHDDPGSYELIDELLEDTLRVMTNIPNGDGLFEFSWLGDSGELADDWLGTITRNGTYRAHLRGGDIR